jgi:hypothetical protein
MRLTARIGWRRHAINDLRAAAGHFNRLADIIRDGGDTVDMSRELDRGLDSLAMAQQRMLDAGVRQRRLRKEGRNGTDV